MSPSEIIRRALATVPPIAPDEALDAYEARLAAWTVRRPKVEWAAASLTFAAAQLSALDTVTKPETNFVTRVGRPTIGDRPMTAAERQQRRRASNMETAQ
jgi:hypothetical protein